MCKAEFLAALEERLSGLPEEDVRDRLAFYAEMIDDKTENGLSEEEAVAEIGSIDEIVLQIIEETPLMKIAKKKIKPKRRLSAWEIVLLALGSPIWISLLVSVFAVFLSLYAVLWSLIVSVWAVFGAFVGSSVGGIVTGIVSVTSGDTVTGLALIGVGVFLAGLSVFMCFASDAATKGLIRLTKKIILAVKHSFAKKEEA